MFGNKKGLFSFILVILMTFSLSAFSAQSSDFDNASDCGVENKIVKQFSWEICEQDFAFRLFYKLFPDVMEEYVLPIVNSKYLEQVKDLESDKIEIYRAYQYSILNIFESVLALAIAFGVFVFIWHTALALFRTSTEGSFLGKDYSWKKTGVKYGLVAFGLLPLGNGLVVLHIIVFLLILFGIAFANLFYSMYLNFLDFGVEGTDLNNNTSMFKETDAERLEEFEKMRNYDHNFFYASEYAKQMVKVGLCKLRTEQFIFENNINNMNSSNEGKYFQCTAESVANSQILNKSMSGGNGFISNGAFSSYLSKETSIEDNGNNIYLTSGIRFGKNTQNSNQCNIDGVYDYTCGEISISPPSIMDDDLIEVLDDVGFMDTYASVSSQIMNTSDASSIESIATSGWNALSTKVIQEIGNNINGEIKLSPNDEVVLKNIAYYYHQLLLNDSLTGAAVYNKNSNVLISPSSNAPMQKYLTSSLKISNEIINNYCLDNQEILKKSKNAIKYLNGYSYSNNKDLSTACLYLTRSKPSNTYGAEFGVGEDDRNSSEKVMKNNVLKAHQELQSMIESIYNKRLGLERSLFKSLKTVNERSITEEMRKVGFASAGGVILKIIKEKEIDEKFMHSFRNSMSLNTSTIMSSMVGTENISTNDKVSSSIDNPNFKPMDAYYAAVVDPFTSKRKDLRFTDISAYTGSLINDSVTEAGKMESAGNLIMETISNPFGSFSAAIGLGGEKDIQKEIIEKCMADLNECPIPMQNPITNLTNFGHNLIKVSTSLMAASVLTSFAKYLTVKNIKSKLLKDKGGSVSLSNDLSKSLNASMTKSGANSVVGNMLVSGLVGALNIVDIILSSFFDIFLLLLLVGIYFAYIIPLIPFMMFTFAFLSWVTMCILALVIAPMWLVFNLKMVEQRDGNSDMFRSGYNIAMQILFRPALTIIALVLGWSLFSVTFLALNLTIVPLIFSLLDVQGGSFHPRTVIDQLMLVMLYGTMVYIMITYVFKLMYTLSNQIFEVLNVSPVDDKANVAEDVMKSALLASFAKFQAVKNVDSAFRESIAKEQRSAVNEMKKAHRDDAIDTEIADRSKRVYKDNKKDTNENENKDDK